jgi:hypothetical protein
MPWTGWEAGNGAATPFAGSMNCPDVGPGREGVCSTANPTSEARIRSTGGGSSGTAAPAAAAASPAAASSPTQPPAGREVGGRAAVGVVGVSMAP